MIDLEHALSPLLDAPLGAVPPVSELARRARRRRSRHRGAFALVAAVAIATPLAIVVGANDTSHREVRTDAPAEYGSGGFPPTSITGDTTVMFLTLLDGTKLEVRAPNDLGLDEFTFTPNIAVSWSETGSRGLAIQRADRESSFAGQTPAASYEGIDGSSVLFYRDVNLDIDPLGIDVLVFQFGSWMVQVPDYEGSPEGITEAERELLASHLGGIETPEGFLVFEPDPPLTLGPIDSPSAVLETPERSIGIITWAECREDASSAPTITEDGMGASWCDVHQQLGINVHGSPDWVAQAVADLEIIRLTGDPSTPETTSSTTSPASELDDDEAAITDVFLQWLGDADTVDETVALIEDGESLRDATRISMETAPNPRDAYRGRVDSVELASDTEASVSFAILLGDVPVLTRVGNAVKIDGTWLVSRETYCAAIEVGPARCPPRQ